MNDIRHTTQQTTQSEIYLHLRDVDNSFMPFLSSMMDLENFSFKIYKNAIRFEAWHNQILVGLLSSYFNDTISKEGFINHIAVKCDYKQQGISKKLMTICINYAKERGFLSIKLEVSLENQLARKLYEDFGFEICEQSNSKIQMIKKLTGDKDEKRL